MPIFMYRVFHEMNQDEDSPLPENPDPFSTNLSWNPVV